LLVIIDCSFAKNQDELIEFEVDSADVGSAVDLGRRICNACDENAGQLVVTYCYEGID
jgi:hypothetical protein